MVSRQALHELVDELPDDELQPAQRFLEFLQRRLDDPFRRFLDSAPFDDEPVTEDDLTAIREGREEKARGEVVPHQEVQRLLRKAR